MNYGIGNKITPFKGREIDVDKPIQIYRNLNRKGRVYSIRQNGLVVGHSTALMLKRVEFRVSEAGRLRVRSEKKKNVHAYAEGFLVMHGIGSYSAETTFENKISYNPYANVGFVSEKLKGMVINKAVAVIFNESGVSGKGLMPKIDK